MTTRFEAKLIESNPTANGAWVLIPGATLDDALAVLAAEPHRFSEVREVRDPPPRLHDAWTVPYRHLWSNRR